MIDGSLIIGLMTSQRLRESLLVDHRGALGGGGGISDRVELDIVGRVGHETGIDRGS